jgi:arylsulfatase A-like enzyme
MRRGKPWPLAALLAGATLFTAAPAAPAQAPGKAPKRVNFVVILVDDLGWKDLSCQGSKFYKTPNIDRVAREGLRFTDGYAAAAVCSPTRAALMTGRYPARLGLTDWIRARFQRGKVGTPPRNPTAYVGGPDQRLLCPPNPFWMELDEVTIAEVLKGLGYVTCHIGKWHLGDDAWYPQHQGFDFNFGGCDYGQPPSYFDPYANKRLPGIPHLPPRRKGEFLTYREASEAVKFIRANKDRPFFLHLAHYAVHTPLMARPEVVAKYKGKADGEQKNAVYAALVESVDDAVGAVLRALADAGVADHTVVIFTSDNGGLLGSTHNGPLRLGKGHAYEGGIRVPWIVRWPGTVPGGTVSHEPISTIDIFPTIVEAAGGNYRPAGRSTAFRSSATSSPAARRS